MADRSLDFVAGDYTPSVGITLLEIQSTSSVDVMGYGPGLDLLPLPSMVDVLPNFAPVLDDENVGWAPGLDLLRLPAMPDGANVFQPADTLPNPEAANRVAVYTMFKE